MLKTFANGEKQTTVAIIEDFEFDAIKRILRVMPEIKDGAVTFREGAMGEDNALLINGDAFALRAAAIRGPIKGIVTCREGDKFSFEAGEDAAVKKAMDNHNRAFKKALKNWQVAILKKIQAVSPETFKEAVHTVVPCGCCCDDEDFK